jgi:protoheme IX farnesyltransferase
MKTTSALAAYYRLTKPGIVYGNALVAAAGFTYASRGAFNWSLFGYAMVGLSLVVASASVCNNYYDRDIDKKMARTSARPLAVGRISNTAALVFGAAIGLAGILLLFFFTTLPAFAVALAGWVVYVFLYTPLKHITPHALWVGAVAGAMPPVAGYAAVTNSLDYASLWLFIFLFVWQVPHFLGIAAYRYDDYAAAHIPLLLNRPSAWTKKVGRFVFYISLIALLAWCAALMLHK